LSIENNSLVKYTRLSRRITINIGGDDEAYFTNVLER
jgi:hypothetical protein